MRELLSTAELKVAELLAQGKQYKHVAYELGISAHTISDHVQSIYRKWHVTNLVQLALTYHGVDYEKRTAKEAPTAADSAEVDRAIRAKRYVVGTDFKDFRVRSFDVV